jgi:predicted O-methyltransferase YrrM
LHKILSILRFIINSRQINRIKPVGVKGLVQYIVDHKLQFYHFGELEGIRHQLLQNHNDIEIVDLGAGSSYSNTSSKKISEVAKQQLSSSAQLQILSRIVMYEEAKHCLELGASLGLSSLYLAKSTKGKVISFEGNKAFVKLIDYQKKVLKISNLNIIEGNFDLTLDKYLKDCSLIDFAFIDGNHREKATIEYYYKIKEKCSQTAILVFDDIYWSKGMTNAWNTIKEDIDCKYSVDLYFMGIIFLDKSIATKEHVKIITTKWN